MSKKLYVGNLNFKATEDDLRELFAKHGEVANVNVVKDMYTGRSRGFAFVEMVSPDAATKAQEALNGQPFLERNLTVDEARPEGGGRKRGGGGRGRDGDSYGGNRGGGGRPFQRY